MTSTYGNAETAKLHPFNPELAALDRQIAGLQRKRDEGAAHCKHHFVPPSEFLAKMKKTLIEGVVDAKDINEGNPPKSNITFDLTCARCGEVEETDVGTRCPCCGNEVIGSWGGQGTLNDIYRDHRKYFGDHNFGYNALWLIECSDPKCHFKAVGLRYDR